MSNIRNIYLYMLDLIILNMLWIKILNKLTDFFVFNPLTAGKCELKSIAY